MALKDQKEFWDTLTTILQVFTILCGGIFALYEYKQKEASDQIRDTLLYVDRYEKPPLHDIRYRLDRIWSSKEADLLSSLSKGEAEYERLVMETVASNQLEPDVFSMIKFFESLKTCVKGGICSAETAKAFFCSDATAFFNLHQRFILAERKSRNDSTLGGFLEEWVKRDCKR